MISMYQLQIFLSVVERGSFSAAAEELHLTQPAVSMQVRTLEERYGVKLFSRIGQRIELTEAGRSLLEPARKLLSQAYLLEEHFSAGLGDLRGRLNISYSRNSAVALYFFLKLLAPFRERYTKVQFSFQEMNEETIQSMALEREINFGIITGVTRHRGLDSLVLTKDHVVLAVPIGHKWEGQHIRIADLKGVPFILRSTGSETRRMGELALRSAGMTYSDLQVVAEMDSSEGVALAVENGLGVGLISESVVSRFAIGGSLALARIELSLQEQAGGAALCRELTLVKLASNLDRQPSPAQDRLWEHLRTQLMEEKNQL
ncbi:LysR substrate-binding domain-containing protein [Candidatus Chlorohelix sp.]|uniref:LysR substrate-binding domain-containing protein n=1 Tax=Candidatus Chlorohelix sp. TaxID=3139201 RepID=UPI0030486A93